MKQNNNHIALIFMHIPKTGGMSLRNMLFEHFSEEEVYLHYPTEGRPEPPKNPPKLISGHFYYGIHRQFEPFSYSYVTIVRHPLERLVSHYRYIFPQLKHPPSFSSFIETERLRNLQTKYVAGGSADFKKAQENLKHFLVCGVTEMFIETAFLLKKELNLQSIHLRRDNITAKKEPAVEITSAIAEKVKKLHALDFMLYRIVKSKLEKEIARLAENEKQMLRQMRQQLS